MSKLFLTEGLVCRLLLMDAGADYPTDDGWADGGPTAVDRHEAARVIDRQERLRIACCTTNVAEAAHRTQRWRRADNRLLYPTPSPVPGDIRTFEENVRTVRAHIREVRQRLDDHVGNAQEAARLQMRIRELANQWVNGVGSDQEENDILNEVHNTDAEIQRLATEANAIIATITEMGRGLRNDEQTEIQRLATENAERRADGAVEIVISDSDDQTEQDVVD